MFGDSVVAAKVRGDGWRKRHYALKRRILSLHKWAGIEVECEVFNLFSGLIPQQGLSRIEAGRKRQGWTDWVGWAGGLRQQPRGGTGPRLRSAEWGEREGHTNLPSARAIQSVLIV